MTMTVERNVVVNSSVSAPRTHACSHVYYMTYCQGRKGKKKKKMEPTVVRHVAQIESRLGMPRSRPSNDLSEDGCLQG